MIYHIPKGQHYAWPPAIGIFHDKKTMERIVEFDITAKYDLNSKDNDDVNKLFGWGYFNGGHHTDSARFGWNWNQTEGKINLFAYCYSQGLRTIRFICSIPMNKKVILIINNLLNTYSFRVIDASIQWHQLGEVQVSYIHKKKWSYKLGCYFGGNNPAPHEITIKIKKK